ncbi:DUF3365 domain-containing protein [uncultured Sneathiella sp.]|uniref:Tll0287-like domain-containing protein n=1 Tax=uncultured Sneathiella sp. TaxID=879315 RepID=UPI0030EB27C4|tara:strand:- start:19730 stop:20491 length:762 start_codon:yes stop_codon:yes gene_type:complete
MSITRRIRILLVLLCSFVLFASFPAQAAEQDSDYDIAIDLATMLQSARSVIGENQELINDPAIGDKGLTGAVVQARAIEKFTKAKGGEAPDLSSDTLKSRLLRAQVEAIHQVVEENQDTINQPDIGFKGFVPAVFARLVNEEFQRNMGEEAEVKVTAPPELIRNRKARPDDWEVKAIRNDLSAPGWEKGAVFSAEAEKDGRPAFRVLVPEYYGEGCLSCHGSPKGELDVTGYPKEGGKVGDLGGVISVTLYQK